MKIDKEFKNLIPPLSSEEYSQLEQNCIDYGIRDSLVITALPGESDTVLIDGHNRFEIAQKHNLAYNVRRLDFKDRDAIKEWIIKNQLGRRNIPAYVRAELALKLKPVIAAKAKENQGSRTDICQNSDRSSVDTKKELAKAAGVSHDTIHKVEKIQEKAPEEVKQALRKGEMSINQAYSAIAAEENEDRRKREERELKEAQARHESYESDSKIVSLSEAKQDKEDAKLISAAFLNLVFDKGKGFDQIDNEIDRKGIEFLLDGAERRQLQKIEQDLSRWAHQITKLRRAIDRRLNEE